MTKPWDEIDSQLAAANDYNTTAEAAKDAAVKAFKYAAREMGLSGFQAEYGALVAYGEMMHIKGPFMVIRGEDFLFPQTSPIHKVREWENSDDMRKWLAEQAQEHLKDAGSHVDPRVLKHWQDLVVDGNLVKDEVQADKPIE